MLRAAFCPGPGAVVVAGFFGRVDGWLIFANFQSQEPLFLKPLKNSLIIMKNLKSSRNQFLGHCGNFSKTHSDEKLLVKLIRKFFNRLKALATAAAVLIFLAVAAQAALAADCYWSGNSGGSSNIDQTGNWFTAIPNSGDNLYFNNTGGTCGTAGIKTPYCNYGAGAYFSNLITYACSGGITWEGNETYLYKFENQDAVPLTATATLANRTNPDTALQINPVNGNITVSNVVLQDSQPLQVYGGQTLTVSGVISQTGTGSGASLATGLSGAATVILQCSNKFTGGTYINNGTLRAGANGALGVSTVYLGDTNGTASAALNLDGGLSWNGQTINVRSGSSGTKSLANTSGTSGTAAYNDNLLLKASATICANSPGAVMLSGSTLDLQGNTLTVDGNGNTTISGTLQNSTGSGALTKIGSGTLTLSGANTYGGGTTIKAGTITFSGGSSSATSGPLGPSNSIVFLGDTSGTVSATLIHSGAAAKHYYPITVQAGSSGAKTLADVSSASVNYSGNIVLNDSVTLDPGSSGEIILSGPVTGTGGLSKVSSGTVLLSAANSANTYAGNATNSQGTLQVGSVTAIPSGLGKGIVILNPTSTNTATFDLNGNNQTVNGLVSFGTGNAVVDNSSSSSITLKVGTAGSNPDGTFAGVIQNSSGGKLGLTKLGTGTLTLNGANTYGGGTVVSSGTLALGSNGSINGSTNISIEAGATYDVSAITSYALSGNTLFSASGTASTATIKGGITVSLGSQPIILTYDGSHPALVVSQGMLSLNGNSFTVNCTSALTVGTYTIIQQANGNVSNSGSYYVTGTAIGSGKTGSISVSGGNVNLVIQNPTALSLTRTSGTSPSTYGNPLTFHAVVSPDPGNGSTISFMTNGVSIGSAATTAGAANLTISTLPRSNSSAYVVAASFGGNANYASSASTLTGGQQVNAATLSITASNDTKTFGQAKIYGAGSIAFTSSGLQNGETIGSVTIIPSGGVNSTNPVGTYTLTPSAATGGTFTAANYSITYINGMLTVNPATPTLNLTASSNPCGFKDGICLTAGLPRDATGCVFFETNGFSLSTNILASGVAYSATANGLPRATTNVLTAIYSGDTNYVAVTMNLFQTVTNHPPIVMGNCYSRSGLLGWKINVNDLLTNANDIDGDTLNLNSLTVSTNGIMLVVSNVFVAYYNTNLADDQFTYTVTDGFGGTNSAVITLTAAIGTGVTGQVSSLTVTGVVATLVFAGIPSHSYNVQVSTNLASWNTIWTTNAPANGQFQFIDMNAPQPDAYYRLSWDGN